MEQMTRAAELGNPYAQHLLGKLYRDGTVVIPDVEKARDWFQQSAEQGLNVARYALGKLLLTDDPLVRNILAGLRWLELAQQNGRLLRRVPTGARSICGGKLSREMCQRRWNI